jgi:glyoxylase-like metal-dependent hydrolase (beta-lactamase superfamily II)
MRIREFLAAAVVLAATAAVCTASAQPPAGGGGFGGGPGAQGRGGPGGPGGPGGRGGRAGGGGSPFGNFPLMIEEIDDKLYRIASSSSGNITVFESDDALLLVDSKFANEYDQYIELLRGVTDKPVKYLVNTHMHGDHAGGNIAIEALGADLIGTENMRRGLAATQATGLPSITFDDHMRLYFGDRTMDFYWFGRGHTDGDLVIHLPDEGLVLPGDLFAGGDPFVRLIDYNGGGSLMEWSDTLEQVMALEFDRVIPGHSELTDRARMQAYLDQIVDMQDLIREMYEAGRAPADIQTAVTTEFGSMAFVVLPGIQPVLDELE